MITYTDFQLGLKVGDWARRISDGRTVEIKALFVLDAEHGYSNYPSASVEEVAKEFDVEPSDIIETEIPGTHVQVRVESYGVEEILPLEELNTLTNEEVE